MPTELDPFERLRPSEPDDPDPVLVDRPRPGHPLIGRLHERADPWVAWFGARRLVGSVLTIVVVITAGWWLLRAPAPPTEAGLPRAPAAATTTVSTAATAAPPPSAPTTTVPAPVVVHVAGAVNAPGVYTLSPRARAADAVAMAGGAAAGADVDALNLAAALRDGERVYVPVVGEAVPPPVGPPPAAPDGPGASVVPGPVDLNRATVSELDALPGVGPATAQAIVSHRDTNGPFASVDDLEQVRGIGPAKLEAIRPLVTL